MVEFIGGLPPKFMTLDGLACESNDPARGVWYSASCGFWTDDWNRLSKFGPGIPCCPECGCPGMQITANEWWCGAQKFEGDKRHMPVNPRYMRFVQSRFGKCGGRGYKFLEEYRKWLELQA